MYTTRWTLPGTTSDGDRRVDGSCRLPAARSVPISRPSQAVMGPRPPTGPSRGPRTQRATDLFRPRPASRRATTHPPGRDPRHVSRSGETAQSTGARSDARRSPASRHPNGAAPPQMVWGATGANPRRTPYPPAMIHDRCRAPQAQGESGGRHRTCGGFSEPAHVQRDPAGVLPQAGEMAERNL